MVKRFLVELTSLNGDMLDEDDVAEALSVMIYHREAEITVDAQEIPDDALVQIMPGYEPLNRQAQQ